MVSQRIRRLDRGGWSLLELLVVVAVIGIMAAIAIPFFASYWRSAAVRAGAQEMRTALQQAKQLAITSRSNVTVQVVGTGYQVICQTANCSNPNGSVGQFWTGAQWSPNAFVFRLQNTVGVAVIAGPPAFTPLGAAAPGGQFQVTGPAGNFLTINVSAAGRITTP
ncbi:MAG: GspH/FimT family protein [candidate division NC10 bacterium]